LSDPRKEHITFDHIFRHTSGLTPQASTVEENIPVEKGRDQWSDYIAWVVGYAQIGLVLAELYQMPAHRFLETRLLTPLGFGGIAYKKPRAPPKIQ
jgi:CubicO group peptidase (beta-lactamase class C family)